MVESVKFPTPDHSSGLDLTVVDSSPTLSSMVDVEST